jgi:hypothetical protein
MRVSTDRIQSALHSPDSSEQMVARRILEHPSAWQQWESEHSRLMRQLAVYSRRHLQVAALKHANIRLLHRKALFHYLQHSSLRGAGRARVMGYFRPGRNYSEAVISEHGVYLRTACSYLCTSHVGSAEIEDPFFLDPMQRYEELYTEYFGFYCNNLLAGPEDGRAAHGDLLPMLKKQLNEYRWAILDPRRAQPWLERKAQLRAPTGDTQRLQTVGQAPRGRV